MLSGSCLCGEVKYNLNITDKEAQVTATCHCRACRKITGATTSLNLEVPASTFSLSSGSLKTVRVRHADEGFEFSVFFCPGCGSPIYCEPASLENSPYIIQVGTLDDVGPLEVPPTTELNVKHRLDWVGEVKGAVQKQRYE
ncbi:hypothetical protein NX059_012522 [Plenodomus lindquistii]|nr:hypothetical protein NX059_012522 [Plenodomus lindquistii]